MSIQVDEDEPCRCPWNLVYLQKVGIRAVNESVVVTITACRNQRRLRSLLVEELLTFCGLSVIKCWVSEKHS